MKIYVVGGYVRDSLLGIESNDVDYCVVNSSPEEMISLGFKQVGKDFPVFLDEDGEEFALARTERKVGTGYHGFETYFGKDVSLEDDLKRRDLTINALAFDSNGQVVDPYGGVNDLNDRVLRHVSESFSEDPLRVLRVARFCAKLPDFTIADETAQLMKELVDSGELNELTPERVFLETKKALTEKQPSKYFMALNECGALEKIFPEIHALIGQRQPIEHHPEGDAFVHTMMVLDVASKLSNKPEIRFGALVHDLGKGVTPKDELPRHIGHEDAGVPIVESLCERLKFPNKYKKIGMVASKYHLKAHRVNDMSERKIAKMFTKLGVDKEQNKNFFKEVLLVCEADARGRKGKENDKYPQKEKIEKLMDVWGSVSMKDIMEKRDIHSIDQNNIEKMKSFLYNERLSQLKKHNNKNKSLSIGM